MVMLRGALRLSLRRRVTPSLPTIVLPSGTWHRERMTRFYHFDLRTTDAAAARRFYGAVLGHERALIWPLHEQALARGAKPHWLGNLGVADPELTAKQFVDRGASPLGPARAASDGRQVAVLRDPGGALLAVSSLPAGDAVPTLDVAYHALNTTNVARAQADYTELFGWSLTDAIDLGADGSFQQFAWQAGGETVGGLGEIAGRPGVHPQWLYFFAVDSLDSALIATRAAGGLALDPMTLASGARACVCDDPQGAAFGLCKRPRN